MLANSLMQEPGNWARGPHPPETVRLRLQPVPSMQPCGHASQEEQARHAPKKTAAKGASRVSPRPLKGLTEKHTQRKRPRPSPVRSHEQDMEANRTVIPFRSSSSRGSVCSLSGTCLQVQTSLVLDLIHGSPDTAVSGPKMSCTRQVPVRAQAVGRSQRIGGTTTLVFTNYALFSRLWR